MKKVIHGDLLSLGENGEFDVIIHGCNCFHIMGGGIAQSVKEKFPTAYQADLQTQRGNPEKLGTYTFTTIDIEREERNAAVNKKNSTSGSPRSPNRKRSLFKMINRISSDNNNSNNDSKKNSKYHHSLTIVNAYTQYRLGSRNRHNGQMMTVQVDYDAVRLAFRNIKQQFSGQEIGISQDWSRIGRWRLGHHIKNY